MNTINSQESNDDGARIYLQGGKNENYFVNSSTATDNMNNSTFTNSAGNGGGRINWTPYL